jgi:hypothetical protein
MWSKKDEIHSNADQPLGSAGYQLLTMRQGGN